MSTLGDALYARLSGLSAGTRVYPMALPQGVTLPAIAYQLVGGEGPLASHGDAQNGSSVSPRPRLERSRVQVSCWADSARAAELLGAEVADAIHGFRGTWGGTWVGSALVATSVDDWRSDERRYRRIVDVLVQWTGG